MRRMVDPKCCASRRTSCPRISPNTMTSSRRPKALPRERYRGRGADWNLNCRRGALSPSEPDSSLTAFACATHFIHSVHEHAGLDDRDGVPPWGELQQVM